jgi:RNA polymerase sigma factor (sigma-70 family)
MPTARLGAVLRHIGDLAADQKGNEPGDGELLHAFLTRKDQPSFEALLRRHGPMVLRVCRRALGQEQDAEDAFQATFLVLARQAGSIRQRQSLAGWLHGVAYRMARNARRAAARRRKNEREGCPAQPGDPAVSAAWQELQGLLDEEVARLPETFREPFVLCCLENRPGAEVARRLGLQEATVWKRVSRARKLLQQRLARRGLSPAVAVTAVAAADGALAAVPRSLVSPTLKAAGQLAAGQALTAGLVPAQVITLVEGVNRAMSLSKAKTVPLLLAAAGLLAAGLGLAALQGAGVEADKGPPPAAKAAPDPAPRADAVVSGRVLGPDGKPFQGAAVYVVAGLVGDPKVRARTDAAGRFEFRLRPGEVVASWSGRPVRTFQVVVAAKGHGPVWTSADAGAAASGLTFRLVKDDVPIEGRILTMEGKPVPGATVRVMRIEAMPGEDLGPYLRDLREGRQARQDLHQLFGRTPHQPKSVTVDA